MCERCIISSDVTVQKTNKQETGIHEEEREREGTCFHI